jgi:hypothetical protein
MILNLFSKSRRVDGTCKEPPKSSRLLEREKGAQEKKSMKRKIKG